MRALGSALARGCYVGAHLLLDELTQPSIDRSRCRLMIRA
jgi:hypothetical protein